VAKKYLFYKVIFIVGTVLAILLVPSKTEAAPAYNYPDDGNGSHYLSASRSGNGIYLNTPSSFMKARFDSSTHYYDIEITDACYWNSIDGGTSKPGSCRGGDVTVYICPSNSLGEYDSSYKSNGSCHQTDPAGWWFDGGRSTGLLRFKRPGASGFATELNMPDINGSRFLYVIVQMNTPGANGFKVRSTARNSAGNPAGNSRIGLGGQLTTPLSLGYFPLSAGDGEVFRVRFQVPCAPTRSSFNIGWYDADRPPTGIPLDFDVRWTLRNVNTGQTFNSAQFAFISGTDENTYLGGQDANRDIAVGNAPFLRVQQGDNFEFTWTGVNRNNGIQVKIPFDEADAGITCVPPNITVFTSSGCGSLTVRADTSTGSAYDARVIRNGVDTTLLRQNIPDNTSYTFNITSLQGTANSYRIRVRDRLTGLAATSSSINVPSCAPTITEFTVNCDGQIRLRVNTQTGGAWAARLYIDGVSTYPSSIGRFPSSGSNASGYLDTSKSSSPWHDVRSHTFRVRVDDQTNSTALQTWSPVRTVGPCLVPTCDGPISSLTYSPSNPEPGEPFGMTFRLGFVQNYGASPGTVQQDALGTAVAPSFNYTATYANTGPPPGFSPGTGTGANTSRYVRTFSNIVMPNPGTYYGNIIVNTSSSGGPTITCSFGQDGDPVCPADCDFTPPTSSALPFIQAFRGDVVAGSPIFESGSCAVHGGSILTRNEGSADSYKGSGGQLGALGRGSITEFVSAALRSSAPLRPNGLTFANSPGTGNFTELSNSCVDYFSGYSTVHNPPDSYVTNAATFIPAIAPVVAGGQERTISYPGSLVILPPGYIGVRGRATIYVDGDLTLAGDITYNTGSFSSVDDIPEVRFIVRGDIFITPNVTELHGTYIAQPRPDTTGGNIYTCAPTNSSPSQTQLKTTCANAPQLKFFGSVVAKQIHLHRLAGTMNSANPSADFNSTISAETFIESPLHWLVKPQNGGGGGVESAAILPPVL
jgi:hypothetical protein